jgi:hypothetical protein
MKGHVCTRHLGRWLSLLLATLAAGAPGCGVFEGAAEEPPAREGSEHHIASLIRAWFSSLEEQTREAVATDRFLLESPLHFGLDAAGDPGSDGLRAWVSDLRSRYPRVEYRVGAIRIDDVGDGSHRARFEVDRRALDAQGASHVARGSHTWIVAEPPGAAPAVLRVEHEPLLSFPGTGPQIVCY